MYIYFFMNLKEDNFVKVIYLYNTYLNGTNVVPLIIDENIKCSNKT